jgi:hypothetical protein
MFASQGLLLCQPFKANTWNYAAFLPFRGV